MGVAVIVLGESGSGKSTSLRNFEPGEVGILNVMGKPLPFRKRLDSYDNPSYQTIWACLASGKRRAWVIDDATYLMENDNFAHAQEKGFEKFISMAVNFQRTIKAAVEATSDTVTYLFMHPETDVNEHERIKTIGKMISEKYNIEGTVPILIDCEVIDGRHVFVSENDGTNLAKAPIGMFPEPVFDNDLKAVDAAIRDYWGMAPLTGGADGK